MYQQTLLFSFEVPMSVPPHSMESFDRPRDLSESLSDAQQRYMLSRAHSQQVLPSFRDIIPAHLHNAIETAPSSAQSDLHSPTSTSTNQAPSDVNRSLATSPVQAQPPPMAMYGDTFDDFSSRGSDGTYASAVNGRRHSDQIPTWSQSLQYPEITTVYSAQHSALYQSQHQSQPLPPPPNQTYSSFRSGPALPSMRETQSRPDKAPNGLDPNPPMAMSAYPPMYGNPAAGRLELENGSYSARRSPYYDQGHRPQQTYPPLHRHHPVGTVDYQRYQPQYDPYRPPQPYGGLYSEVEFAPQPAPAPQSGHFNVVADAVDPRGKRRRGNLPKPITDILRAWFHEHLDHPYPTEEDKQMFIARTGLTLNQISNWFINARRRQLPSLRQNRERASQMQQADRNDRFRAHETSIEPR